MSKETLDNADIAVGDEVDVAVRDGLILIAPVKCLRGKYKLSDLVKRISSDYQTQELQCGEAVGKEVW